MSEKKPVEIKHLKPGGFVLFDDVPCVVEKVQKSKSGKHGAAKARVMAKGIFDNVKKIVVKPGDAKVDVPMIEKKTCQILSFSGDYVQIMDLATFETSDVKLPEDLKGQLVEGDEILIWAYEKYVMIKGKKT